MTNELARSSSQSIIHSDMSVWLSFSTPSTQFPRHVTIQRCGSQFEPGLSANHRIPFLPHSAPLPFSSSGCSVSVYKKKGACMTTYLIYMSLVQSKSACKCALWSCATSFQASRSRHSFFLFCVSALLSSRTTGSLFLFGLVYLCLLVRWLKAGVRRKRITTDMPHSQVRGLYRAR